MLCSERTGRTGAPQDVRGRRSPRRRSSTPTVANLVHGEHVLPSQRRAKPRFDFVTDVAGDEGTERVVIHEKDIVVFGKGFRNGTSYAFISVGVTERKDILDVSARDITGDGRGPWCVTASKSRSNPQRPQENDGVPIQVGSGKGAMQASTATAKLSRA